MRVVLWVAMHRVGTNDHLCFVRNMVSRNRIVGTRFTPKGVGRRIQPHAFLDHLIEIAQALDAIEPWRVSTKLGLKLPNQLRLHRWIARQQVEGVAEGERRGCKLLQRAAVAMICAKRQPQWDQRVCTDSCKVVADVCKRASHNRAIARMCSE